MGMNGSALLSAALLGGLLASGAAAKRADVPEMRGPREDADPEFRKDPAQKDLASLVKHLGNCIAAPAASMESVTNIDQFLLNLEAVLRKGNDVPRDRIIRNADLAREYLRLAYNDLAEATAPQNLPQTQEKLKAVADQLPPLLERNRTSVGQLRSVADTARATVGAMVLAPPESPGQLVPVPTLAAIAPLRPEIVALFEKLKEAAKTLKRSKAYIARAKEQAAALDQLAEVAGRLDDDALGRLSERRTRGTPVQYQTKNFSREVILNANKWLKQTVEKGEAVVKLMEEQVKPQSDGVRKALDKMLDADGKTQDSKELETRSGNRINYNHKMRLNGVIAHGWEVAADNRKAWWVGRSRMARREGDEDSKKMDDAHRDAADSHQSAELVVKAGVEAVERLGESLGRGDDAARKLVRRPLDVPAPRDVRGKAVASNVTIKSKGIKIPHTLEVSDSEIIGSYDTNGSAAQ